MKHRIEIDGGAFIGSNYALTVPASIGNSTIAEASSVITDDVPDVPSP